MNHPVYPINYLPDVIPVGIQAENGVVEVAFDVRSWLDRWPGMRMEVWARRPTENEAYPAVCQLNGGVLYWHVSRADTAIEGNGTVEIRGVKDDVDKRTGPVKTLVRRTSLSDAKDVPEAVKPWYDDVMDRVGKISGGIDSGESSLFLVTMRQDWYSDRTQEEIRSAVAEGKTCLLIDREQRVYTYYGEHPETGDGDKVPTFVAPSMYQSGTGIVWQTAQVKSDGKVVMYGSKPARTPNPWNLTLKKGEETVTYNGSKAVAVEIPAIPTPTATTAYLRWDGTAWVAATIDQLKADLGLA